MTEKFTVQITSVELAQACPNQQIDEGSEKVYTYIATEVLMWHLL